MLLVAYSGRGMLVEIMSLCALEKVNFRYRIFPRKGRQTFMELCKGVTVLQHSEETISLKKRGTVFSFELCHPNCFRFSVTLFSTGKSKCWGCSDGVLCNVFCELAIGNEHYGWYGVTCRKVCSSLLKGHK